MSKDALTVLTELAGELRSLKNATITFPGLTSENEQKAASLQQNGRDFFLINQNAETVFTDAMQKEADRNPDNIEADDLLQAGAEAFKKLVVERFEAGGKDVPVKPLKQSTIQAKGSSRVGVDSGSLLQNLKGTKPLVRKT